MPSQQRLYYTTSLETLEKFILPQLQIRLSTFDKVNDPFELLAIERGGRTQRRRFNWLYNYWVAQLGFVSLSETWRSPLVWAHYADDHKGVCLGIDVPAVIAFVECKYNQPPHSMKDARRLRDRIYGTSELDRKGQFSRIRGRREFLAKHRDGCWN